MSTAGAEEPQYEGQLETRIWLKTLKLHSQIYSSLNSALQDTSGLTVARFEVLAQLDLFPNGISLGKLSERLRVTGGNVSGLVKRLLADELITKTMSSKDRRSFFVSLTPKGKQLFDDACIIHRNVLVSQFSNVGRGALEDAIDNLTYIGDRINDSN